MPEVTIDPKLSDSAMVLADALEEFIAKLRASLSKAADNTCGVTAAANDGDPSAPPPTIYAHVEENRVAALHKEVRAYVEPLVSPAGLPRALDELKAAIREAYRRGVIDGFQQGVAATNRG